MKCLISIFEDLLLLCPLCFYYNKFYIPNKNEISLQPLPNTVKISVGPSRPLFYSATAKMSPHTRGIRTVDLWCYRATALPLHHYNYLLSLVLKSKDDFVSVVFITFMSSLLYVVKSLETGKVNDSTSFFLTLETETQTKKINILMTKEKYRLNWERERKEKIG